MSLNRVFTIILSGHTINYICAMLYKIVQRLSYLNSLIEKQRTGTPKELAEKLGLSERGWYKLRDELVNDLKLPIVYCPHKRSYLYLEEGTFEIGFKKLRSND